VDKKLNNLVKTGEGYHLEFKESADKSFIEEVCAFANASGGKIILGISDSGEIKGAKTSNSFLSKIQDIVNQLEPKLDIKISTHGNLVVVDIPEGSEKPYGCSKGFFIRIGPNSQKLKRNEIVSFFQKEGRIRFDELENTKADIKKDFNESAFNHFLQISSTTPSIEKDFLLKNLDCISGNNRLTNAGVLFFTKSTEFLILQATVVCVLYKGTVKLNILDKKDFSGDIIKNIEDAVLFIKRHTNLEYKIEKLQREEIPDIPEPALREAVINAVCHRDYFEKGAHVVIEIFDDRVEISNPGGLPSGLSPKDFGKKSVVRNPIIASLLHRANYIERLGTGINRIKQSVKELGKVDVEFSYNTFFTVTFRKKDYFEKKVTEKVTEKVTGKVTENQKKILENIAMNPHVTTRELSGIVGISDRKIKENIKKLKENGLLRRIGPAKGGYWKVDNSE